MSSLNYYGLFEGWEIAVAKKLIHDYRENWKCLKRDDFDDLLQECLMRWLEVRDTYDQDREASEKTFMARIVRNLLINIVEKATAEKRKAFYESESLDAPLSDEEDAPTLKDQIASKQEDLPQSGTELRLEIARTLQKLSPQQKELCRLIGEEGLSINEACSHFGKHRSNIYRDVIRIKEVFEKEGLKDYLK